MGLVDIVAEPDSEARMRKKEFQEALQKRRVWNMWHSVGNAIYATIFMILSLSGPTWLIFSIILWVSISWTTYRTIKLWPTRKANQ